MCGIIGYIGNNIPNENKIEESLDSIKHRGPDNASFLKINENVVLGHTRLSIIDLDVRSNQPMVNNDYTIVFNGEIFNFKELKGLLVELGYSFNTDSDTEVLLNSYIEWGEKCVDKFNGMWAFCIYDKIKNKAFISRDRFGIKPFKYFCNDNELIFASEAKAIFPLTKLKFQPNSKKIVNFIKESEGCFSRETWFDKIYSLEPGHNLIYKDGKLFKNKYYDLNHNDSKSINENFYFEFLNSVKRRLISDVPIGFTLSSGIDSSSIVNAANDLIENINTYTSSFESSDSEHEIVDKFTHDLKINRNFVLENFSNTVAIEKLVYHLESGHGSPAIFPLFSLYDKIKKDGIKVVLEGQGADELLAGYISANYLAYVLHQVKNFKFFNLIRLFKSKRDFSYKEALIKFMRVSLPPKLRDFSFILRHGFVFEKSKNFTSREIRRYRTTGDYFKNFIRRQHSETLTSLLHYGDAISMSCSIESRLPFMDINLVEFCNSLPNESLVGYYNSKFVGKLIMRNSMVNKLPSYILENKKLGYPTPVKSLLNSEWAKEVLDNIYFLKKYKILNNIFLGKIKFNRGSIHPNLLYRVLITEVWFKRFYLYR